MNDPWLNEIKKRMSDLEIDEPPVYGTLLRVAG